MGELFTPEYLHIGIMLSVIAGIILIAIIFLIIHLIVRAKETKGMSKEQRKAYYANQKAIKEKALAEERSKPICANCYHYDGYGHCKANYKEKWVDNAAMDDGYFKKVYLRVNRTSTCDGFLSVSSKTACELRNKEEGIPKGFRK